MGCVCGRVGPAGLPAMLAHARCLCLALTSAAGALLVCCTWVLRPQPTVLDQYDYEYCMHGKVFKYDYHQGLEVCVAGACARRAPCHECPNGAVCTPPEHSPGPRSTQLRPCMLPSVSGCVA